MYVRAHTLADACSHTQPRTLLAVRQNRDAQVGAWSALVRAHKGALQAIESDVDRAAPISLGWYDVLLELRAAPVRQLRMQDLASRVVLSRTRVSRLVDEMVRAGLIEKQPDLADGRASLAILTGSGEAALRRTAPRYVNAIEAHFGSLLTREELRVLTDALNRIAEHHHEGHRTPSG